jgi:drug/metabolite transporter (DMT)-like permease
LYHRSIVYIGPGLATILPNFQVLVLAAAGVLFFGEPLRSRFVVSIPLAFVGLFFLVGIDWDGFGHFHKTGVYCGLAAALCYAGFILMLRKLQSLRKEDSAACVLMYVSAAATIFLGARLLATKESFAIPDMQTAMAILFLGLFSQTSGWLMIANSLPELRASLAGLILLLQPALAFLWDVIFFRRPTSIENWFGVSLALAAIYLGLTADKGKIEGAPAKNCR